ncbi:unnamed protein product, partial [Polarella glacialis]
ASRWRPPEEERRQALLVKRQLQASLEEEVRKLRLQLKKERQETADASRQLRDRIDQERREEASLQMRITEAELGGWEKTFEVSAVHREVQEKTKEILEAMQDLREQQQQSFKQA